MVTRLRAAGCVFAEEEASILREAATDDEDLVRMCARRVAGEPIEHIVGWVEFAGRRLAVGPGVFVPRKRSELLAAVGIAAAAERVRPVIVEPYCGAAPLAATIRDWLPDARVYATDVDETALRYARRNLGDPTSVYAGPDLTALPAALRGSVDVIVAVPPYVPDTALALMPHEAADHEPHRALLAGPDGLDHLTTLAAQAPQWLVDGGVLAMELNAEQMPAVIARAPHAELTVFADDDSHTVVVRLTFARPNRGENEVR
ncbi:SAM-dependent methyltransferase [Gordonia sp. DT219]|uniref:SAM-dependent methyltransferase n=1 Tax=Gordonia sp. DT219 TaxID=3416658 RepID=UPI003CF179F7